MASGGLEAALGPFQEGRYGESEPLLRALLAESPDDADATHFLGIALREMGRGGEGLDLMRRSVALAPMRADFHYNLANAHDADSREDEALAAYREALRLRPEYPQALMNLAMLLAATGQMDEARESLERLVKIAPRSPTAHLNLARLYQNSGRHKEALGLIQTAAALKPTTAILCELAVALRRDGQTVPAVLAVEEAQAAAGAEDAAAWMELGQAFTALENPERAAAAYARVLAIDPDHIEARFLVAALEAGDAGKETIDTPPAAPASYVAATYDAYAPSFERHLVETLKYRAPSLVYEAVMRQRDQKAATGRLDILDLGCGTGLAAPLFAPLAATLTGVDLARNMLALARRRNLYTRLEQTDIAAFMRAHPAAYDLILAVDVLIHVGDLTEAFAAAFDALRPGGLFAFSVEAHAPEGFVLQHSRRFAHALPYLEERAAAAGFTKHTIENHALREECGVPVVGYIAVLTK